MAVLPNDLVRIIGDSETGGVSRYLPLDGRSWAMLVAQQQKKVLDSEVNFLSQLAARLRNEGLSAQFRESGFLFLAGEPELDSATAPTKATFQEAGNHPIFASLGGHLVEVVTYNDHPDLEVTIDPASTTSILVMLEVWFEEIEPTSATEGAEEVVSKYGNEDDPTGWSNDLEDAGLGEETSRRVQARYKLRAVKDVNFTTYTEGVDDTTNVKSVRNASFTFSAVGGEVGLYRTGTGSEADATSLLTVDGYSYAVPMAKISYNSDSERWDLTDLRHNLTPHHAQDMWPAYASMLRALCGAATPTADGVFDYGTKLAVSNLHETTDKFYVDIATGQALVLGYPYSLEAAITNLYIGDEVPTTYCQGFAVVVELNKRSRQCQIRVLAGSQVIAPAPEAPTLVNNAWVCQIPLATIELYGPSHGTKPGESILTDARNFLPLSGNYDDIYIRQDGGGAVNSVATETLWGINNGVGAGVRGEGFKGPGGHFLSNSAYSLITNGPAILERNSWAALAQQKWYEVDEEQHSWATGVLPDTPAMCASPTHLFFIGSTGSTLYKFIPGDITSSQSVGCGTTPKACCFDGKYVWVLNQGSNNLTKVLASTMAVSGTYSLGVTFTSATGVVFDGKYIWVMGGTASYTCVLIQVNPATGGVLNTYNFNTFTGLDLLSIEDKLVILESSQLRRMSRSGISEATYATEATHTNYNMVYDGAHIWIQQDKLTGGCWLEAISPWNGNQYALVQVANADNPGKRLAFDGWRVWVCWNQVSNYLQAVRVEDAAPITKSLTTVSSLGGVVLDPYGGLWLASSAGVAKAW